MRTLYEDNALTHPQAEDVPKADAAEPSIPVMVRAPPDVQ